MPTGYSRRRTKLPSVLTAY